MVLSEYQINRCEQMNPSTSSMSQDERDNCDQEGHRFNPPPPKKVGGGRRKSRKSRKKSKKSRKHHRKSKRHSRR